MTVKKMLLAGIAVATATTALPALAIPLTFQLSGTRNATFTFDPATTTPDFFSQSFIGDQASYNAISGTFGGVQGTAFVGFGNNLVADLNIQSPNLGFTQLGGTDFFSIVNARPVFTLGTYALNGIVSGANTLTISAATSAVPEPASWAMLMVGFGMVGGALRHRGRKAITARA